MGHSFPLFLGVHLRAVSGISQNPSLWTNMRLEHNLRGSLAAFVRRWLEAIRSCWRCGDRKRQVGPGGPAYKQGSTCAPSHAGVYTYLLSQALRHLEGNPKNYCWEGDNFLRWREGILRADIFTFWSLNCIQVCPCGPLGREDPLEEGKATHSSILAWRIPWTTAHGVTKGEDWETFTFSYSKSHIILKNLTLKRK